jgi:hypothetical protein
LTKKPSGARTLQYVLQLPVAVQSSPAQSSPAHKQIASCLSLNSLTLRGFSSTITKNEAARLLDGHRASERRIRKETARHVTKFSIPTVTIYLYAGRPAHCIMPVIAGSRQAVTIKITGLIRNQNVHRRIHKMSHSIIYPVMPLYVNTPISRPGLNKSQASGRSGVQILYGCASNMWVLGA